MPFQLVILLHPALPLLHTGLALVTYSTPLHYKSEPFVTKNRIASYVLYESEHLIRSNEHGSVGTPLDF